MKKIILVAFYSMAIASAFAQEDHSGHDMSMDHSSHDGGGMEHHSSGDMDQSMDHGSHQGHDMSGRESAATMDHSSIHGGSAADDVRDPHAYSGGKEFGTQFPRIVLADQHSFGSVLMDRLEAVNTSEGNAAAYELKAWYGRTYHRLVFRSGGHVDKSELEDSHSILAWSQAVSPFWNVEYGLRLDQGHAIKGYDVNRSWITAGFTGLAPYWFEMNAMLFVGEESRTGFVMEAEYELLITQKLILQPVFELIAYGKEDVERGLGEGLSSASLGLRLRYELWREFAPYLGISMEKFYGDTAKAREFLDGDTSETTLVVGLRFWF